MNDSFLNIGLYSVSEASSLSGVKAATIRRWLSGYSVTIGNETKNYEQLWGSDIPKIDSHLCLSFRDLIEIRFINEFRKIGVGWDKIRAAVKYAAEELEQKHPFCSNKFVTDRKRIFAQIEKKMNTEFLDTKSKQYQLPSIIKQSLYKGLEFDKFGIVNRWYPSENSKDIVIDPELCFGRPVIKDYSIPTEALAKSFAVEKSFVRVANLYEIKPSLVKSAVEFQKRLAA